MKFKKKPIVIEALMWKGDNFEQMVQFFGKFEDYFETKGFLVINTLEGRHKTNKGDWVIKGIKGEFYPCKPDIFEQTYEKVIE